MYVQNRVRCAQGALHNSHSARFPCRYRLFVYRLRANPPKFKENIKTETKDRKTTLFPAQFLELVKCQSSFRLLISLQALLLGLLVLCRWDHFSCYKPGFVSAGCLPEMTNYCDHQLSSAMFDLSYSIADPKLLFFLIFSMIMNTQKHLKTK